MLHFLINQVDFKEKILEFERPKRAWLHYISQFVTGKEVIAPIYPQFRVAKNC